ncbi:MAG: protein kinase, partial [Acidobacteria bacterium]|nr:protein kinase [Acidobacteriota bacterium]
NTEAFSRLPTQNKDLGKIYSLLWDSTRQTLWVGANAGLLRCEPERETRFVESAGNPDGLPGNFITDLALDTQGHLWIGTTQGALGQFYVDQRLWGFRQVWFESNPTKDDSDINCFFEDAKDTLWVATLGRIYRKRPTSDEVLSVSVADPHFRYALFFFEDDLGLWMGGGGGLYRLEGDEFIGVLPNKQLKKMLPNGQGGYFLAGLGQGLMVWSPEQGLQKTYTSTTPQGLPNDHIFDMRFDSLGRLWLGTRGGLAALQPGPEPHIVPIPFESPETGAVMPIECQSLLLRQDQAWLSTYGQGLFTFPLKADLKDIRLKPSQLPFPTPNLMTIAEDSQQQIWISSLLGLFRLNSNQTGLQGFFRADGLQDNEFNGGAFLALKDGSLIVGGINGFNQIQPETIPQQVEVARLVINHLEAWRAGRLQAIQPSRDGAIHLDYRDYNIRCGFSLLEFRNPELVHYAYYLAGSKIDSWVPLGKNAELNLPLIPPGQYTLHVRALSDRGLPPQEIALTFHVKPPFWETTWFRLVMLAVLAALTHLLFILGKRLAHIVRSWRKTTFFGDYELIQVLGKGGMGTVYRARKRNQKTEVALKILDQRIQNADRIKRFIREGLICESISHPNVVKVFEKGSSQGRLYFSMELFKGATLSSLIQEGQWTVTLSLALADALLDILKSIHDLGIQHRDLKPDNIMILNSTEDWPEDYPVLLQTMRNRIKLLDFGLAKAAGLDTITQTGDMFGTISYLPPETLRGEPASGYVTDFYAFGIVCYEMLAGKRPFEGEDFVSLVYRVLNENPEPPLQLNPAVPELFSNWVMALIAKDINARLHDGISIRAGLAPIVRRAKTKVPPAT